MNAFSKIDMGEVTRLTQAGKLAEAMALLQGHTASSIARGSPGSDVPRLTQGIKRPSPPLPTIDMVAPSAPGRRLDGSHSIQAAGCRRVRTARQGRGAARPRADDAGVSRPATQVGPAFQCRRRLRTCATGAGPRAGRGSIRGADLLERRRKSDLQGVRAQRLLGSVPPGRGHAARLHSEPRRLRRWHTDERSGRGADVPGRLSASTPVGKHAKMLELVQRRRPAARERRAIAHRWHRPAGR